MLSFFTFYHIFSKIVEGNYISYRYHQIIEILQTTTYISLHFNRNQSLRIYLKTVIKYW